MKAVGSWCWMRPSPRFSKRAGLTLLELLVALALMALIGAGIAGAMGIGIRVFERAQVLDAGQIEQTHRRQLRRFLMEALPPTRITPFPNAFRGGTDTLSFVTLAEAPFALDAAALQVTVTAGLGPTTMVITAIDDQGRVMATWEAPLAEGAVTIRYLGETEEWRTDWEGQPQLPRLLDISISGSVEWPPLTVAPRLR